MSALPPTARETMKAQVVGYWTCTVLIGSTRKSEASKDFAKFAKTSLLWKSSILAEPLPLQRLSHGLPAP